MHTVSQATPDLIKLFDEDTPVKSLLFSILEGRTPAEIVIDDLESPGQCIVRSGAQFTFASRNVDQGFLDRALTELRQTGGVALVGRPDGSERWTPSDPDLAVERLGFRDFRSVEEKLLGGAERGKRQQHEQGRDENSVHGVSSFGRGECDPRHPLRYEGSSLPTDSA